MEPELMRTLDAMTAAAKGFLDGLDEEQRAAAPRSAR